jgi:hypothetical protein
MIKYDNTLDKKGKITKKKKQLENTLIKKFWYC